MLGATADEARAFLARTIADLLAGEAKGRMWSAVERAFGDAFDGAHIDKVGFAKEGVGYLERTRQDAARPPGLPDLEHNFGELVAHLAGLLHEASINEAEERTNKRTDRIVRAFLRDYADAATRDVADQALRDIEASLEDSPGDEAVKMEVSAIRRDSNWRPIR
jgi:hypothetical protein